MDESVLWAVALGTGALGLLLLAVGGLVAVYWNIGARRARDLASAGKSQSPAGDAAPTGKSRPPADSFGVRRTSAGDAWAWLKAWIFALVHAGTVSLVLGGITFFEDLARAGDEIKHTGTVTFPRQLLPGTLFGPTSHRHLPQPSGDSLGDDIHHGGDHQYESTEGDADGDALEDLDQADAFTSDGAGWEMVSLVNGGEVGNES